MASDAAPRRAIWAGALLLGAAAWSAGAHGATVSLATTGSVLAALAAVGLIRRGLAASAVVAPLPPLEIPVGVPHDQAQMAARVLALESQVEHAPIALFRIDSAQLPFAVEPVNANARRLLAPGRATDLDALRRTLAGLAPGQRRMIDVDTEQGIERALATAGALSIEGRPQRLVALTPMENELAAEAMQAWQKLVHVLTHEIMNSLTPVASLSHSARDMVHGVRASLPPDIAGDLGIALDAIARRADSLTRFVSGYRALASVPEAAPQRVVVQEMFARLSALIAPAWQARGGSADFRVEPESLELMADPGQLEQALVNLLQNAAQACTQRAAPHVAVSARLARGGRLRIEVCDNGPGVPDEVIADIFTPFFSTKSKGGGIGLAMVRQLVHRNGGAVRYAKSVGTGARFIITF
ncbi:sensor histidine kinase [Massilia pseudoviolaceinigra]|uniref:sensor histidine kinase n=1 Tax=Massilia pseudoviolaceinigra TaxID=3057165 RepID=UPI002796A4E2|nr:sensor histidine kinase [Massilia sp. CCM 9206]MDQ1920375.1 sensor histidine kinase [Massilia sp. CCM 9206]